MMPGIPNLDSDPTHSLVINQAKSHPQETSDMKPQRNEQIQNKILPDGHVVLFNETNQWAHVLTPQGALLWELCDGQTDLETMGPAIAEASGRPNDNAILRDLGQLVNELLSLDLLIVGNAGHLDTHYPGDRLPLD